MKAMHRGQATRLTKAARLAVLLDLDRQDLLAGRTLQEIADALGEHNHRSTILRDLRLLKQVRRLATRAARRLDKDRLAR